ncbi:MAG TPA: 60S ribosomal export protein NMD3 [Thermoplasmata archaeon]|nr:60S ribosomal export protein NMD3 [Thermoplasmata archaeon]
MSAEFCVVCGRTDRPLTDGECADCFAKRVPLVTAPPRPIVVLCPTCGSRYIGQHWEPSTAGSRLTASDLTPLLLPREDVGIRRVRWTETGGHALQRQLEGAVEIRFRGTERTVPVQMVVRVEHRTCPTCSRKSGRYYTAIIQLRAEEGGPRETARARRERLAARWDAELPEARPLWRESLSWGEARPEGWDFYLTDTLSARALARFMKQRLGGEIKESATLYGRKDGRDVYRVTFCLRVPMDPPEERPHPASRPRLERHA